MEISSLTLRVLLLFFPGVLCTMLVDGLTVRRERTPVQFITKAFVLGIGSYLLLYALRGICSGIAGIFGFPQPLPMTFFAALADEKQRIAWGEIALAAGAAIPLATVIAALLNHRVFFRAAEALRITRNSGYPDVWSFLFNAHEVGWVHVRDLTHDLTYYGWVERFSETVDRAEFLLRDVQVYRGSTGVSLYETSMVYFARPSESLVVEIVPQAGAFSKTGAKDGRRKEARHPPDAAGPGLSHHAG